MLALALLLAPTTARSALISFDDIPAAVLGATLGTVPNGYQGFDWGMFGFIDGSVEEPGSGYENGAVSGDYTGFNQAAALASMSGTLFTFESVWLTAAWRDGLMVHVEGFELGVSKFATPSPLVVDSDAPTFFEFDWAGVDEVRFTAFGGSNAGLGSDGTFFAIDDLSYGPYPAPEPPAAALAGLGLLLAGLAGVRRSRAGPPEPPSW